MNRKEELFKKAWEGNREHLRPIANDEIVIEFDNCTREEGTKLAKETINELSNYQFEFYDHGGKSPHIHIKNIKGLEELDEQSRKRYKEEFVKKYSANSDKVDLSLCGKHLIAIESKLHFKKVLNERKNYGLKTLIQKGNKGVENNIEKDLLKETKKKITARKISDKDIVATIKKFGFDVKDNKIICPFHPDTDPSLHLYPETNSFYCFGCDKGGSTETFIRLMKDKNEKEKPLDEHIKILKDPNLFKKITEHELDKKIVGEVRTRKVILLCGAGGRLVENCQIASFNLLINDDAGTGKDYITKATLEFLPEKVYIHKTRISPTAFTYWHNSKFEPEWTWDGKVFYTEDISEKVLNSDVFKVMCSSGSSATIVVKQIAVDINIKGKPVMITTTATSTPKPELVRRFMILDLNSSVDQTKAIMEKHTEYGKKGLVPEYDMDYRDAMNSLKRVKVKIPFAGLIYEYFPTKHIIMRTLYPRFLDFIKASAAFHQFQRIKDETGYILAEGLDYNIARECFFKLCSNKYMIPLTINQKKILKIFEKNNYLKGSVIQLHPQMSFVSIPSLQNNLRLLSNYGILKIFLERDNWNRDMEVFVLSDGYSEKEKFNIPKFNEILGVKGIKGNNYKLGTKDI